MKIVNQLSLAFLLSSIALSSAYANQYSHGFTLGYAKTNYNVEFPIQPKGGNFKYHFKEADSSLGFISSVTYTRGSTYFNRDLQHMKLNYFSLLVGPSFSFTDYLRIYALGGVSSTLVSEKMPAPWYYGTERRTDFAYGGGLQFKIDKVLFDFSYERADYNKSIGDVSADTFTFGIGYEF